MNDFNIEDDLLIGQGDFVIKDASQQNIANILRTHKGSFKEFPILGIGLESYLNGNIKINKLLLEAELEKQLAYDNFDLKILNINNFENIEIDGNY